MVRERCTLETCFVTQTRPLDGNADCIDSIPNLNGKHKRYLYGPGSILVAHSDHEQLKASQLLIAVKGYKRLVRSALKS